MSVRRFGISVAIVVLCTFMICICLTAVFIDLIAALWMLVATLIVAFAARLCLRKYAYFAARSLLFDLTFLLCLILALTLMIPSAMLPSPV